MTAEEFVCPYADKCRIKEILAYFFVCEAPIIRENGKYSCKFVKKAREMKKVEIGECGIIAQLNRGEGIEIKLEAKL